SPRKRGPIATGLSRGPKAVEQFPSNGRRGVWVPAFAGTTVNFAAAALILQLPRDFLQPCDQLVHGLVDRGLLGDHAVHRLGPDILVVENRELPVLGEVERRGAAGELVVDRLAVAIGLPERARLARLGHREPAAERALDIGPHVLLLQQEADELLA